MSDQTIEEAERMRLGQDTKQVWSCGTLAKELNSVLVNSPDGISLNEAAKMLQVDKRRLYDVANILEGAGVVERPSRGFVRRTTKHEANQTNGEDNKEFSLFQSGDQSLTTLQTIEKELDRMLEIAEMEMSQFKNSPEANRYGYVTKADIQHMGSLADQQVMVIKAPAGSTLSIPQPEKEITMLLRIPKITKVDQESITSSLKLLCEQNQAFAGTRERRFTNRDHWYLGANNIGDGLHQYEGNNNQVSAEDLQHLQTYVVEAGHVPRLPETNQMERGHTNSKEIGAQHNQYQDSPDFWDTFWNNISPFNPEQDSVTNISSNTMIHNFEESNSEGTSQKVCVPETTTSACQPESHGIQLVGQERPCGHECYSSKGTPQNIDDISMIMNDINCYAGPSTPDMLDIYKGLLPNST